MHNTWKTPIEHKQEKCSMLIIIAMLFIGFLILGILCGNFGSKSSSISKKGQCATVEERYSGIEHTIYCDSDYDWIDAKVRADMDLDYELEQKYEAELHAQQAEEKYYDYCYQNNWDC